MRILLTSLALMAAVNVANARTLTIYTYDSFVSDWGPGPLIKAGFEKNCACEVKFVGLEDGVAILSRLKFEGESARADVAIGLDTNLAAEAKATNLFAPHAVNTKGLTVPGNWSDDVFVPYDFGYFAFIYDKTRVANPPQSLEDLVKGNSSIIIQDPRSSSPGLGLTLWMRKIYGHDTANAWAKLAPRIVTVTKGWSEAYGLFLKGEADMVLSYTTSPAYHLTVDKDDRYEAAAFAEGHYMQIELAAKLDGAAEPELADQFLAYLVSAEAQAMLPETQWMFPVNAAKDTLPAAFDQLIKIKAPLSFTSEEVMAGRSDWVAEWREALSR